MRQRCPLLQDYTAACAALAGATDADCGSSGKCGMVTTPFGNAPACTCATGSTCPALSVCKTDSMGMNALCYAKWCDMRYCPQAMMH